MTNPIDVWHADHARFAHLLQFLDGQLAAYRAGNDPDYALMRDVVHYLHHNGDSSHHPREDEAFKRLVTREPSLALPVERLLQEHRVLDALGKTLVGLLDDVLADVVRDRADLEAAAATYVLYYLHHLATEEREIVPRAAELLTPDDWTAVAAVVRSSPDPLSGSALGAQYRDLSRRIAPVS